MYTTEDVARLAPIETQPGPATPADWGFVIAFIDEQRSRMRERQTGEPRRQTIAAGTPMGPEQEQVVEPPDARPRWITPLHARATTKTR